MGKFRSKLKGGSKGRRWKKGQSSSSNPSTTKYRDLAKARFCHENLGCNTGLTTEALKKHNAIHIFGRGLGDVSKSPSESELSIAKSLQDISLYEGNKDGDDNESGVASFKTFQTFASDWSACSNQSFFSFLRGFDPKCNLHKEMLAILAAVTEIIKEKKGNETNTEYYVALMETLKASETDESTAATIYLLSMGLKKVPQGVLQKQFSEAVGVLIPILEQYVESENNVILRCTIGCLSVFLRAQEYAVWNSNSTLRVFESVLVFVIHSKPKIRKAAQHAICAILRGSYFMLPSDDPNQKVIKLHPAANRVATLCLSQMKAEVLISNQTTVLHALTLLTEVIPYFSKEYIKTCCESLLSLMTQNDILVKTCCLKVLHSLFINGAESSHLTSTLTIQMIRALTAYRPNTTDIRQILAWLTVMQCAFMRLALLDLDMCMASIPNFVQICVTELWLCDNMDVMSTTSNALKVILLDCVKPACQNDENVKKYWNSLENIFKSIKTGLDNPFNQSTKQVILTLAVCFEIGNENIKTLLAPILNHLNERRESPNFTLQKEMEYATGCAVKYMGPEFVLDCIPLKVSSDCINLDRSWLLLILKEKIQCSSLKYFNENILSMASLCRNKSKLAFSASDQITAHTYELLCGQLWALLPNFCNNPVDVKDNFKTIARTLGTILKDNPDFRPSVMQGLRKLISTSSDKTENTEEIARFAKNFLPLLLNVYLTPVKGSYAEGQRLAALETIKVYLTIAPQALCEELFQNAFMRFENSEDFFTRESLLDIVRVLVLHQSSEKITLLFDKWIFPLCENSNKSIKKSKNNNSSEKIEMDVDEEKSKNEIKDKTKMINMEHKKAYRILEEILKENDKNSFNSFLTDNRKKIQKMLMQSLHKLADSSKATRLRCIQYLIKLQPNLNHDSKIIKSALPEAVICTKDINSKCRKCAYDLIITIGDVLGTKKDGFDHYVSMLENGLQGPVSLMTPTILCLASAIYNFTAGLGLQNLSRIMEKICELLKTSDRQTAGACVAFLKVYSKSLPSPLVGSDLPLIFSSISEMNDDCKRHCRSELGSLLTRLMRKYGADTVGKLIPESDVSMHRKLRYVRKMDSRKKRQRESKKAQEMENDSDEEIELKSTMKTLEEILQDSDSEIDVGEEEEGDKYKIKSNKKTGRMWIHENPESILDLMDPSSARHITATAPVNKTNTGDGQISKKKKREIKTTPDGKLILHFGDSDSDLNDDKKPSEDSEGFDGTDDDASAAETLLMSAGKKRKRDDAESARSVRSRVGFGSRSRTEYVTGGKGIHRKLTPSVRSEPGSEYRSERARGDMKKKGKPDPYAYVPLLRNALNKRKKLKHAGQFENIMRGARRGATAGRISKVKTFTGSKKK